MLRATLRDVPESRPSCKARYYANSGTKSSITNLHARSLPVGATKLIFLVTFPREFQSRRVGIETPSF